MSPTTVLDLSTIRTFKLKNVVLAYKDCVAFDHLGPEAKWVLDNPVRVVDDGVTPRELGNATVRDEGGRLVADLFLDRECPQRLDIEAKTRKLYPIAFCQVRSYDEKGRVGEIEITHIEIRPYDNPFDDRIQPLSESAL